jgi:hypothetical protein
MRASPAHALPQRASRYWCQMAVIVANVPPHSRCVTSPHTSHATVSLPPERPAMTGRGRGEGREWNREVNSKYAHHAHPPPRQSYRARRERE